MLTVFKIAWMTLGVLLSIAFWGALILWAAVSGLVLMVDALKPLWPAWWELTAKLLFWVALFCVGDALAVAWWLHGKTRRRQE